MLSPTLAHENRKNEIRQRNEEATQKKVNIEIINIIFFYAGEASVKARTIGPLEKSSNYNIYLMVVVESCSVISLHGYLVSNVSCVHVL